MGLSTVKGIIQQHRGLILVSSEPDQGSVFELYLPLIDPPLEVPDLPDKQGTAARRGTDPVCR